MTKRGFTLIELLVVVAIIGLLAAIILAGLSTTTSKARDAARKSGLHQIQVALEMYATKNGHYPSTGATDANNGGTYSTQVGWLSALIADGDLPTTPPVDPQNADHGAWCWSGTASQNTIYVYLSDGTHYVLCGWLENANDAATLGHRDINDPWNPSLKLGVNYNYPNNGIVIAQ